MLLNESTAFGTRTCIVSPRTEINWNVETNDGTVSFRLERLSTKKMEDDTTFIVERYFDKVLAVPISTVVGRDYEGTPGMTIMAGLKSATRAAYDASAVTPDPDADPIAPYVAIVRDPINGGGSVTFTVEDRGAQLGTMVADVGELLSPTLLALIDLATDAAIGESL